MPAVCQVSGKNRTSVNYVLRLSHRLQTAPMTVGSGAVVTRCSAGHRKSAVLVNQEGLCVYMGCCPRPLPTAACGRRSAGLVLALLVRCIPTSRRRALQSLTALANRNCHPETPQLPFAGHRGSESEARLCRGVLGLLLESLWWTYHVLCPDAWQSSALVWSWRP